MRARSDGQVPLVQVPLTELKGVGPALATKLGKLGVALTK